MIVPVRPLHKKPRNKAFVKKTPQKIWIKKTHQKTVAISFGKDIRTGALDTDLTLLMESTHLLLRLRNVKYHVPALRCTTLLGISMT